MRVRSVFTLRLTFWTLLSIFSALIEERANAEVDRTMVKHDGSRFSISNATVEARVTVSQNRLSEFILIDRLHTKTISINRPFAILLKDGSIFDPTDNLTLNGPPKEHTITGQPDAARIAATLHGKTLDVPLESTDHRIKGTLSFVLLDGAHYLRQVITIYAPSQDLEIRRVELVNIDLKDAHVSGSAKGSPIVASNIYVGFEHPLSESNVTEGRATAWMNRDLSLKAGQSITYSAVFGVTRAGQMRRDFLTYVEQERAHPYRTFLHYNSWYDLGYFTPYDEADAIDRVSSFGTELTQKRGVKLDSFLFDDGWDNHKTLWKFNAGFPNGFIEVKRAAEKFNAAPGVWMSPWGGYSKPKQERIEFGRASGYEIVSDGYALSGPKYYSAFRDVCLDMVRKYGVNQFKFDGTGNVNSVFPGSSFDSDFSAAIHLVDELRLVKPDIFINLTTGTWPSPFWLQYADSIWRGGEDDDFAGVGTYRERWITYRDADTYQRIVQGGPLFPLNSLMLHGIIFAKKHPYLNTDPGDDFRNEVRSYFGTGTQLQEMYITPSLLSSKNWDDLAEASQWSRSNADVLKDTHWVGGDPSWLEVYGWASWTPKKGILVLRNPSDQPKAIDLTLQSVFELPQGAAATFTAKSPWREEAAVPWMSLAAQRSHHYSLAPFQVLTLEFTQQ
jgi:hypothetical protein